MQIDPRLNQIDDCLYRVAIRVLIVQDDKVLLVKENEDWWAFPGGGIEHGETVESALTREVHEELGVPANQILSDFQIVHHTIGAVVKGIPRVNLYYKVSVLERLLGTTTHVIEWAWFNRDEFMKSTLNPSFSKTELADVIFGDLDT
jgi:8-oxo-dGTP pyrophosphatase MutT (NUDIX family)